MPKSSSSKTTRKAKAISGQLNLIGDVYCYNLKYQPHKSVSDTGEAVVVLRIPSDATMFDRTAAHQAADEMSGITKQILKKDFWYKRHRDNLRKQELQRLAEMSL